MKFRYFSRIFSKRWINSHFWCQELFLVEFFSCTTNWVKWLLLFMKISKGYVFKIFNQLIEITAWGKASLSSWRDFSFSVPVISWHLLKRWDCEFFWIKYPPSRSVIVFGELSFFQGFTQVQKFLFGDSAARNNEKIYQNIVLTNQIWYALMSYDSWHIGWVLWILSP